ncbi:MAG: type IV pilus assembly protein PilM [Planctomycetota bacterium]
MIGLDIGHYWVKALEIRSSKAGNEIKGLARKELPPEIRKENRDPRAVSQLVKDCLAEGGISGKDVVIMVSGPQVFVRRISMPPMPRQELDEVIPFEATKHVSFPVEQLAIDYLIIGEKEVGGVRNQDILIVAIPNEVVEKEVSIAREAGLKPVAVTASPLVMWKAFQSGGQTSGDKVTAILDIGFDRTTISLINDGALEFARSINVSGDEITKSLMTTPLIKEETGARPLTYDEAENLKQEHGFPPPADTGATKNGIPLNRVSMLLGPVMEKLLGEVRVSIDFYMSEFQVSRVDKIIMSGGSSALSGLKEYLSGNLGIDVGLADPFQGVSFDKNVSQDDARSVAPAFVMPFGLATWAEGDLSLFNKKKKKFRLAKERQGGVPILPLLAPGFAAAMVIAFSYFNISNKLENLRTELDGKKRELVNLGPTADRALKLVAKKNSLEAELDLLPQGISMSINPARILEEIRLSAPDNTRLEKITVIPNTGNRLVEINGTAFSMDMRGSAMSDFMTALNDSPLFSNVSMVYLEAKEEEEDYTVDGLKFHINCQYNNKGG